MAARLSAVRAGNPREETGGTPCRSRVGFISLPPEPKEAIGVRVNKNRERAKTEKNRQAARSGVWFRTQMRIKRKRSASFFPADELR